MLSWRDLAFNQSLQQGQQGHIWNYWNTHVTLNQSPKIEVYVLDIRGQCHPPHTVFDSPDNVLQSALSIDPLPIVSLCQYDFGPRASQYIADLILNRL
jgi:hypothetical protein